MGRVLRRGKRKRAVGCMREKGGGDGWDGDERKRWGRVGSGSLNDLKILVLAKFQD